MSKARNQQDPVWKDGFLFLGNQSALDFLNTRPVQDGEAVELLPDFGALLHWFQAANLLGSREAATLWRRWGAAGRARRVVEAMQKLREKLRVEVLAWEHGASVDPSIVGELNRLMAEHPMLTRLKASGRTSSAELYFKPREPEDLFAPLAHGVATLFANADRRRVRKCAQCVLHFLDASRKGTRRWCRMQLCGNRQKVAAYAARQRLLRP